MDYKARLLDPYIDGLAEQISAFLVTGPRASGKTTTLGRRVRTIVRLDLAAEAAAFEADPEAALRSLEEPVLLDEWQAVPTVLPAVRRAVEEDPRPNRFYVTGSVNAELKNAVWPATGRLVRTQMFPMTVRERQGNTHRTGIIDKLVAGDELTSSVPAIDILDYLELAMESGFPVAALHLTGQARDAWLESYLSDLLTHDVESLEDSRTNKRDAQRMRRYFEAFALNSAGIVDHKAIYERAGVKQDTGIAYEGLLLDLLIVEKIMAWQTNRLRRLTHQEKRYVVEPALIPAALRIDRNGVFSDRDLLGRLIDTFVAAQLRSEVALASSRPRLYHLRQESGRHEVDLLAELGGGRVIAFEVKAGTAPTLNKDAKHLAWLKKELDDRFLCGVVFHTGPQVYELDDRIIAAPISAIWA